MNAMTSDINGPLILVVDDVEANRNVVSRRLENTGYRFVAVDSGEKALRAIENDKPDLILLDYMMPGMNGMETLKQIQVERPGQPVVMLSMHPEEQYAVRCIKAGAAGYLTKACERGVLVEAVRRAAAGRQYLTPEVGECLLREVQQPGNGEAPHLRLSDREFEVFRKIASGVALADMAAEMHLSPKTVSTYRARILEKMGLAGNAELMRYAFEHGLAGP